MALMVYAGLPSAHLKGINDLVFILAKTFHHFLPTKWRDVLLLQLKPLWGEIVAMFVDDVCRNPLTTSLRWVGPPIFGPGLLDFKQTSMICSNIEIPDFRLNIQQTRTN